MKATERVRKGMKKAKKAVSKSAQKSIKKATGAAASMKKEIAKRQEKLQAQIKEKAQRMVAQKESQIKKLKEELAQKEKMLAESKKGLLERAKEGFLEFKEKAETEAKKLMAEAEAKAKTFAKERDSLVQKLKSELEEKGQALRSKIGELEQYRKIAEGKMTELEEKGKEIAAKVFPPEKARTGLVTFKGNPLTLLGPELKVGDKAPDFRVVDNSMQVVTLDSFRGKVKIISAVPSLDTPVCDLETRRFNEEAGKLPENVAVLTISMDLPFAQKRWCAAAGVEKVRTLSDYQERSFGLAYGVMVKELRLLARTVFIVDDQDYIRYLELVPEIAQEPDYDRVLNALKALL